MRLAGFALLTSCCCLTSLTRNEKPLGTMGSVFSRVLITLGEGIYIGRFWGSALWASLDLLPLRGRRSFRVVVSRDDLERVMVNHS